MGLGGGWREVYDELLNYYIYAGTGFFPIQVKGTRQKGRTLMGFTLAGTWGKLEPKSLHADLYEYNYLKFQQVELSFQWYKNMLPISSNWGLACGIGCHSNFYVGYEVYRSILYDNTERFKKSYSLSLAGISLGGMVSYRFNHNNKFSIEAFYVPFSLVARPSDNFVKSLEGLKGEMLWQGVYGKDYGVFKTCCTYQRIIGRNYFLAFEAVESYQKHAYRAEMALWNLYLIVAVGKQF